MDFPSRCVLDFGRGSVGLPPEIRARHADRLLRIPMLDAGVRSLNLSTSVAMALYEVLRQRAVPGHACARVSVPDPSAR